MASSSGITSSGSEENPSEPQQKVVLDERRRKRMVSNRESARRSRMRKQKHLDELMTQVEQLRKEKNQILTNYNTTTQRYVAVEAENSVVRTQMVELNHRLESLNEILNHLDRSSSNSNCYGNGYNNGHFFDFNLPMDLVSTNFSLPIMASPDNMFLC